jgi:hypothetical protein
MPVLHEDALFHCALFNVIANGKMSICQLTIGQESVCQMINGKMSVCQNDNWPKVNRPNDSLTNASLPIDNWPKVSLQSDKCTKCHSVKWQLDKVKLFD